MSKKKSLPGPITILMMVIVIAALSTWILPAGQYNKLSLVNKEKFVMISPSSEVSLPFKQKTLDSLGVNISIQKFIDGDIRKAVSVPGTFQKQEKNSQGFIQILQAPIKGIIDSIDIILFILFVGGFMYVFNETGAMVKGITYLSHVMRGKESRLIIILTSIFSFLGASYGMAEESIVFYPLLVPIFIAAGYDLLIPIAVIYGGVSIGGISSFSNPFSTIIASNAAGINWMDGLYERILMYVISTFLFVWFILKYAKKVKNNPSSSLVFQIDGIVKPLYDMNIVYDEVVQKLELKTKLLLGLYFSTFITMIAGVVFLNWWTTEMSALFLVSSILIAIIIRMNEKIFISEFINGAQSFLSVAFIVGVARGVTVVLNEGHISDSILFYTAHLVQGMPAELFIVLLLVFYAFFSLFISSSSGMAVLTMPIIGAMAIIVNIPGREIVNSYNYGMGIMSFVSPTGLLLPSLALVNVSLKVWMRFIMPLITMLIILCALFLIIGICF